MWRRFAPTAMRMPISRVRSVTETSRMFMMPMPPTRSEIDATLRSSVVITWLALSEALRHVVEAAHGEVVVLRRADAVPLAQQRPRSAPRRARCSRRSWRSRRSCRRCRGSAEPSTRRSAVVNGIRMTSSWSCPHVVCPFASSTPITRKVHVLDPDHRADRVLLRRRTACRRRSGRAPRRGSRVRVVALVKNRAGRDRPVAHLAVGRRRRPGSPSTSSVAVHHLRDGARHPGDRVGHGRRTRRRSPRRRAP